MHWREAHRQACLQLEPSSASSSPMAVSFGESFHNDNINLQYFGCGMEQILAEEAPPGNIIYPPIYTGVPTKVQHASVDPAHVPMLEKRTVDKKVSRKSNTELFRKKDGVAFDSSEETFGGWTTQSSFPNLASNEVFMEHKVCISLSFAISSFLLSVI